VWPKIPLCQNFATACLRLLSVTCGFRNRSRKKLGRSARNHDDVSKMCPRCVREGPRRPKKVRDGPRRSKKVQEEGQEGPRRRKNEPKNEPKKIKAQGGPRLDADFFGRYELARRVANTRIWPRTVSKMTISYFLHNKSPPAGVGLWESVQSSGLGHQNIVCGNTGSVAFANRFC
jgi:hypothetical protein